MKRKIILSMVLSALLVFAPCYVNAVDENTGSEDKTNNETVVGGEENKENTNNENKEDKNESTDYEKEDNYNCFCCFGVDNWFSYLVECACTND